VLHELFPDNLDHGLDLAHVQPREEALATLAQLRLLPPPTGDDPRIDLAEYDVGAVTSDRRKAVERATAKGRARGARLIVGLARGLEGWGAWDQGNIAEAQAAWDESLGILEVRGQFVGVTGALRGRAGIALLRDDIDRALELYSSAEARLRAVGNHSSLIYALNNVAHVRTLKGDLPAARAGLDESLALAERVGNKMKVAQSSHALGRLEHQLGDMTAAGRAYDRALALCDELSDPWLCRGFLGSIGQYHAARDDFARARDEFQRIIAGKDAEGRARTAAPDRRDFAALALEEGKLDEAMDWIDQALAEFEREEAPIERALAEGVQARIWAAKGDMGRARAVVDAADARSARSKNKLARIQVRIAWARIHALDPDPAARRSAMRALAEARADSARYGFYPQLLEARFGEGEAEAASGDRPRARACFTAVERDARARGFTLLARRAAERRAALR
jgi:tetratricopeptide (TPR) repeat protein